MKLLVVGDANADLSAPVSTFPVEGDDVPLVSLGWSSGGSAANVAVAAALLGAPTRLLARVGCDPAADVALRAAQSAGVDLSLLQRDPTLATGLCFAAISPNGERTFFSFRGANTALSPLSTHDLPADIGWLHIAGHALLEGHQRNTTIDLITQAHHRHIPISLDLCLPLIRVHRTSLLELLPYLATLFCNERELQELSPSDDALRRVPCALVKRGAAGCDLLVGGETHHIAGFPVAVVDTTGAGDAFVAGFLYARLNGCELATSASLANVLGALTAQHIGAAEALPTRERIQIFLGERDTALLKLFAR